MIVGKASTGGEAYNNKLTTTGFKPLDLQLNNFLTWLITFFNHPFFFLWGLFLLLSYIAVALEMWAGCLTIPFLKNIKPQLNKIPPKVSIIIPACNEADTIEQALQSVMAIDYAPLEIIVINDRSTDGTGEILDDIALREADKRLKVIHNKQLPSDWLGKNHAMDLGAKQATGDYLLFTDADVHFGPETINKAMTYLQNHPKVKHLVAMPQLTGASWLLQAFYGTIGVFFLTSKKPWFAPFKQLPFYMGVGAFNLIEKTTYQAIGGHQAIKLRPDDDMRLGYMVKKHGFKQQVLWGRDEVQVEWYTSPLGFINGLIKNTFAFNYYSVAFTILGVVMVLMFHILPFIVLPFSTGLQLSLYSAIMIVILISYWEQGRYSPRRFSTVLGFPLGAAAMAWVMAKSAVVTLKNGGIYWRGTFYPLEKLKANKI